MFIEKQKRVNKYDDTNYVAEHDMTKHVTFYATAFSGVSESNKWIFDSSATQHMCFNSDCFEELTPLKQYIRIKIGDGRFLDAKSEGKVVLELCLPKNKVRKCVLEKVL